MPNVLFDIPNPPSNNIILDASRQGRVQFTVNNVSGRPLTRVAARLTSMPDASGTYSKWLKLTPEGFREFKIADSLQYTVDIVVPPAGAEGNYGFRLDVWDDTNPDDTLVNGPSMTFTVPAPPPPPPLFPWWIPVVVVAAIVVIVGAVIILKPGNQPPPTPTATLSPTVTLTPMPTGTPTPAPSATPTRTPTPVPIGNFNGHWNLGGDSQGSGASADIMQNGANVVGTFFNGTLTGAISGFIDGDTLAGQFRTSSGSGTFQWTLVNGSKQFQGTWSDTNAWCGWRNGSSQPNPCKPLRIIVLPSNLHDRVLKITLQAP